MKNKLRVYYCNAHSIRNKFSELHSIAYTETFDIIVISESWLKTRTRDLLSQYSIKGYKIVSNERENRPGGGILVYISERLKFTEIKINNMPIEINIIALEIKVFRNTFKLISIYRPPHQTVEIDSLFYNSLSNLISENTIFIGDFNNPSVNFNLLEGQGEGKRLLEFMENMYLEQYVTEPTR